MHLLESDFRWMLDRDGDFAFGGQISEVYFAKGRGEIG